MCPSAYIVFAVAPVFSLLLALAIGQQLRQPLTHQGPHLFAVGLRPAPNGAIPQSGGEAGRPLAPSLVQPAPASAPPLVQPPPASPPAALPPAPPAAVALLPKPAPRSPQPPVGPVPNSTPDKLPQRLFHSWYSDEGCTRPAGVFGMGDMRTVLRQTWNITDTCISGDIPKVSYMFVCKGATVVIQERPIGCPGAPEGEVQKQLEVPSAQWEHLKRGECVFYGTNEINKDIYAKLSEILPPAYGVNCTMTFPPPKPSIANNANITCPAAVDSQTTRDGVWKGRRLELLRSIFKRFEVEFEQDALRKYTGTRGKRMRKFKADNEPAQELKPQQYEQYGFQSSDTPVVLEIKLLIAVMTPTIACDVRNLHRATWMTHDRVCTLSRHAEAGCQIFPVFAFANVSREGLERADDIVILTNVTSAPRLNSGYMGWWGTGKTREMWREGQWKTPGWFRHALSEYPWATHVAKMDLDTYPFIDMIYQDLVRLPQNNLFYGIFFGAWRGGMYGEFYLVTRDLMACWVEAEWRGRPTRFQKWQQHAEDQVFAVVMRLGCPSNWYDVGKPSNRWLHLR